MWELRLTDLSNLPKITHYEHIKFYILFHSLSIFTCIENGVLNDLQIRKVDTPLRFIVRIHLLLFPLLVDTPFERVERGLKGTGSGGNIQKPSHIFLRFLKFSKKELPPQELCQLHLF